MKLIASIKRKLNAVSVFNSIRGKKGNRITNKGFLYKCKIRIVGKNNVIEIKENAKLIRCRIVIHGSGNRITIGADSYLEQAGICMDFDKNSLLIGERCIFSLRNHFSVCEGKTITIGNDCLTSADIHCRTTDSHTILNQDGERINPAQNISIGDHVWIGASVTLLKGASIGSDSVVSYGSIVTKAIEETNCIIAGTPAKIVKQGINWDKKLYREEDDTL